MTPTNHSKDASLFTPPATRVDGVEDTYHGVTLTDHYRWLEDKESEEVKAWTKAQHQSTLDYLDRHFPAVEGLRDEIEAYTNRDLISPLQLVEDRKFFTRKKKGENQAKLFTLLGDRELLLFDPEELDSSGKSSIQAVWYTQKGDKAVVAIQLAGAEIATLHFVDTMSGKKLFEPIEGMTGSGSWTKDGEHIYCTTRPKGDLSEENKWKLWKYKPGTDFADAEYLGSPVTPGDFVIARDFKRADVTIRKQYNFSSTQSLKIQSTGKEEAPLEIYSSDKFDASINAVEDRLYIYTNHEAPNFKIMLASIDKPEFKDWKEFIPEGDTVISNYTITHEHLLLVDKKDLFTRVKMYDLEGKFIKELKLPEVGNVWSVGFHEYSNKIYLALSSASTPYRMYSLDTASLLQDELKWELFYEQDSPIDTAELDMKLEFVPSKDGTKVPILIYHHKDWKAEEPVPCLLYGYGGFNSGITPSFAGLNSIITQKGGLFVMAGIRGGDEYGESWHENGKMEKKQNTFDDFIAVADYLVQEGYTSRDRLCIYGGSNGGLLVSAVINQRPDLCTAVVCAVPLIDMIRYPKFLIGKFWVPEYGDPEKEEDFRNILMYSSYHNIRMGVNLPTMLVTAGENDSRVDPLHAKKYVAALQNNPGQKNPIMLYVNYDSGHGTGQSTEQQITNRNYLFTFILNSIGL